MFFRVFNPRNAHSPFSVAAHSHDRGKQASFIQNSQKLKQNTNKIVWHIWEGAGNETKCGVLDLKGKDQGNHKGTSWPDLCPSVHWTLHHTPFSVVWVPPTPTQGLLPASHVCQQRFAPASCTTEAGTEQPGHHPTQVSFLTFALSRLELTPQVKTTSASIFALSFLFVIFLFIALSLWLNFLIYFSSKPIPLQ